MGVSLGRNSTALAQFDLIVEEQIQRFSEARSIRHARDGSLTMAHYHACLTTLFHQTYIGRTHWRWILNDLEATGYAGSNPRTTPPHSSCQAFVGLLHYVADEIPIARLAIAAVLEGIGARHGAAYGRLLVEVLHLRKSQASFFLGHGATDKTHAVELREAIAQNELTADEWMWMNHAASTGGAFYRAMYDHEAFE